MHEINDFIVANTILPLCFPLAQERVWKTKNTKLMVGGGGLGLHEAQLESVNPNSLPTYSAQKSEWDKAEGFLHAASGCPRGIHLIRGKFLERELIPTIV